MGQTLYKSQKNSVKAINFIFMQLALENCPFVMLLPHGHFTSLTGLNKKNIGQKYALMVV